MSRASALAQARLERHNTRHNTASTKAWARADPSEEVKLWEPRDKYTTSNADHYPWPLKLPGPAVGGVAGKAKAVDAADRRPFDATTTQSASYPSWSLPVRRGASAPKPERSAGRIGIGLGAQDGQSPPWTSKQEIRVHPPQPSRKEAQQRAEAEQEERRAAVYAWEGERQLDETTTAKQDYRAWPAARRAERDLLARAAAEAAPGISASASLLEQGGAPEGHRACSASRSDYIAREIALPESHTPMAFGLQLNSHGRARFFAMLTSGMVHSEAVVTAVLNGQTRVALRVVAAAPAVGPVHQVVSSAEPLVLLDEFALSEIDPAPRGTAELLVRFELTRAAGASTPLLRVTCANQLQQRPGTANPCVTVPVGEYL